MLDLGLVLYEVGMVENLLAIHEPLDEPESLLFSPSDGDEPSPCLNIECRLVRA